ncbi:ArsC/Spx/MgsR family protein [Limibacter armeniacum]|uniref:arsenate reductase family protein n=1 Tax=Limibacter armeniacum TaxID=466084 RepID=UPI002FE53F96
MRKVYHLSTCDTCKRIIKELGIGEDFEKQDIKTAAITTEQLDEMKALAGSYESLFSRRSRQYAARGLKDQQLNEDDYRSLILEEYTFLKRPVFIIDGEIFIGNTKKTVEAIAAKIAE